MLQERQFFIVYNNQKGDGHENKESGVALKSLKQCPEHMRGILFSISSPQAPSIASPEGGAEKLHLSQRPQGVP